MEQGSAFLISMMQAYLFDGVEFAFPDDKLGVGLSFGVVKGQTNGNRSRDFLNHLISYYPNKTRSQEDLS